MGLLHTSVWCLSIYLYVTYYHYCVTGFKILHFWWLKHFWLILICKINWEHSFTNSHYPTFRLICGGLLLPECPALSFCFVNWDLLGWFGRFTTIFTVIMLLVNWRLILFKVLSLLCNLCSFAYRKFSHITIVFECMHDATAASANVANIGDCIIKCPERNLSEISGEIPSSINLEWKKSATWKIGKITKYLEKSDIFAILLSGVGAQIFNT